MFASCIIQVAICVNVHVLSCLPVAWCELQYNLTPIVWFNCVKQTGWNDCQGEGVIRGGGGGGGSIIMGVIPWLLARIQG